MFKMRRAQPDHPRIAQESKNAQKGDRIGPAGHRREDMLPGPDRARRFIRQLFLLQTCHRAIFRLFHH